MRIEIDEREIIPLKDFELSWRWNKSHSPNISEEEKELIRPLSKTESKRLNKVISYFENESNLKLKFTETDWIYAGAEDDDEILLFRSILSNILEGWNEDVIISWNRNTVVKTSKVIFLKYWDDFCYPTSDDVTIISKETNWVMFYNHIEVVKIWTRNSLRIT